MYSRICAQIDLTAIKRNVEMLMGATEEGTKAMAVVKADAYGHGDLAVARAVESQVDAYGVATAGEALNLRKNGIEKPVLILGYTFPEDLEAVIENNITMVVFDREMALDMSSAARRMGKKAKCHIKVDTGMRRIGVRTDDAGFQTALWLKGMENLEITGIFTHFAKADEPDKTFARQQLEEFENFVERLIKAGMQFDCIHCSNSAGVIDMPMANKDMVRLGIAMYGMYPSQYVNKRRVMLFPALSLKSHVTMVKTIAPGESVSYGGIYTPTRKTMLATVPVGYGDGYPRNLSDRGYVLIHGQRAPVRGRICMDQMMVDVTDIPDVARFDEVTLLGKDGGEAICVEELAEQAGIFNYEFVCNLGKRIPREYILEGRRAGERNYFVEDGSGFSFA